MLEESVIYQDIFKKGERRGLAKGERRGLEKGLEKGLEQEARKLAIRFIERRFGKLSRIARRRIEHLAVERSEALCDALFDFQSKNDLTHWLKQYAPPTDDRV